jgi:hypothetical protein
MITIMLLVMLLLAMAVGALAQPKAAGEKPQRIVRLNFAATDAKGGPLP